MLLGYSRNVLTKPDVLLCEISLRGGSHQIQGITASRSPLPLTVKLW